jgi:uncharacterized protein (TIGR02001 family)
MARHYGEVWIKSCVFGLALAAVLGLPAQAQDMAQGKKLELSATATFMTDYVFRGFSQTAEDPAVQGSFDATYGMFYAGIWGSNVDFGGNGMGSNIADLELNFYGGITPTWGGFSFDIGGIYYVYPGAFDPGAELDYFELKTGVSYTFAEKLTVGLTNYWSPEYTGEVGNNDVLEVGVGYAFGGKLFNFFSPSINGLYGHQWGEKSAGGFDYDYWNVGLTLGFLDHWSADVRYWDTGGVACPTSVFACDGRVVGAVSASF